MPLSHLPKRSGRLRRTLSLRRHCYRDEQTAQDEQVGQFDSSPPHGRKVLVGGNDTKETCHILQEAFERDLTHVVVTKLRVCLGSDGPEVLPMILFPEGTNEPGLRLLRQARKLW